MLSIPQAMSVFEECIIFISESTTEATVKRLIEDSDIPDIYEKLTADIDYTKPAAEVLLPIFEYFYMADQNYFDDWLISDFELNDMYVLIDDKTEVLLTGQTPPFVDALDVLLPYIKERNIGIVTNLQQIHDLFCDRAYDTIYLADKISENNDTRTGTSIYEKANGGYIIIGGEYAVACCNITTKTEYMSYTQFKDKKYDTYELVSFFSDADDHIDIRLELIKNNLEALEDWEQMTHVGTVASMHVRKSEGLEGITCKYAEMLKEIEPEVIRLLDEHLSRTHKTCESCSSADYCITKHDNPGLVSCSSGQALRPCPICGSEVRMMVDFNPFKKEYSARIECETCRLSLPSDRTYVETEMKDQAKISAMLDAARKWRKLGQE